MLFNITITQYFSHIFWIALRQNIKDVFVRDLRLKGKGYEQVRKAYKHDENRFQWVHKVWSHGLW